MPGWMLYRKFKYVFVFVFILCCNIFHLLLPLQPFYGSFFIYCCIFTGCVKLSVSRGRVSLKLSIVCRNCLSAIILTLNLSMLNKNSHYFSPSETTNTKSFLVTCQRLLLTCACDAAAPSLLLTLVSIRTQHVGMTVPKEF